ncbi:FMN-dependent dehydrogenase, partial [Aureobasidium melanogenum]
MTKVGNLDMSTEMFGQKVSFPFGYSPAAMHAIVHPEGEVATSRAAAKNNICMGLSSYSTKSIEEVKAAGGSNPYGIQICFHKDRRRTLRVIRRAEVAGFKALFLSVDIPVLGLRLNEYRNSFTLPDGMTWPNFQADDQPLTESDYAALDYDADFTWEDSMRWLREHTKMEICVVVLTPEDVSLAVQHGADGVLISNHGGRQLDGVPATLDALRECAPVASDKIKIAVDGGIRKGSDIFKAIALGADFCFAGRVPIWGLAYKGEDGVDLAIKILMREFKITMALCGCRTIKDISKAHLSLLQQDGRLSRL